MSTTSRPRIKSQAVIDKCQVEIVDLKGFNERLENRLEIEGRAAK
jgi:hypothetical protein